MKAGQVALLTAVASTLVACGAAEVGTPPASNRCTVDAPRSGQLTVGNPVQPGPPVLQPPGTSPAPDPAAGRAVRAEPPVVGEPPGNATVTYPFGGDGVVGWTVSRVAMGLAEGRSDPVAVLGRCVLQVDFSISRVDDYQSGELRRIARPENAVVSDLLVSGPRGGILQSFIGTRATSVSVRIDGARIVLTLR